jgi:hypothetical protein
MRMTIIPMYLIIFFINSPKFHLLPFFNRHKQSATIRAPKVTGTGKGDAALLVPCAVVSYEETLSIPVEWNKNEDVEILSFGSEELYRGFHNIK